MAAAETHPLLAMLLDSQSKPSYRPSPDVAQVLWMYLQQKTGALRQHCIHLFSPPILPGRGKPIAKQLAVMHDIKMVCKSFRLFSTTAQITKHSQKLQDALCQ